MGEYISREAVVEALNSEGYTKNMRVHKKVLSIPAADVVEVVRCRECKHHDGIRCFRWNSVIVTGFNDFCSNGERKDGGQDDGT